MDQRIEAFLTDALVLADEEPDATRECVRVALRDCEAAFRHRNRTSACGTKPVASAARGAAPVWSRRCINARERG
jgi:hypothetical protein